jgi:hypothetical protein
MPTSIETDSLPDFIQVVSIPNCDFTLAAGDDPMPLLYAEKPMIIDSVVIGIQQETLSTSDAIVRLTNGPSAAQGEGSAFTICGFDIGNNVATGYTFETTTQKFKLFDDTKNDVTSSMTTTAANLQLSNTLNFVPAGNWICLSVSSASGFAGGALKMTVQLRIRTRIN